MATFSSPPHARGQHRNSHSQKLAGIGEGYDYKSPCAYWLPNQRRRCGAASLSPLPHACNRTEISYRKSHPSKIRRTRDKYLTRRRRRSTATPLQPPRALELAGDDESRRNASTKRREQRTYGTEMRAKTEQGGGDEARRRDSHLTLRWNQPETKNRRRARRETDGSRGGRRRKWRREMGEVGTVFETVGVGRERWAAWVRLTSGAPR